MRVLASLLTAATVAITPPAYASCKLALALALDISSSVDESEYRQQLEGLADALVDPRVIQAALAPPGDHMMIAAYEWSGYKQQNLILNWTMLDSADAIRTFSDGLRAHRRSHAEFATAIGKGVEFGAYLLRAAPPCDRNVIDVSGDGQNNDGVGPDYFARIGLLDGITVNGLVIQGAIPDPARYYNRRVLHGDDAFLVIARDFSDYRRAMIEKLMREMTGEMILGRR